MSLTRSPRRKPTPVGATWPRKAPPQSGSYGTATPPTPAGDLTVVKASHKSMDGTIATSWTRDAAHFTLEVTVPPNTSATIWLPAKDPATVTESGRPVKFLRTEPGVAIYEVPSGAYTFRSTL